MLDYHSLVKCETIIWNVKCEQDRELIIGIMSLSTEKVYSEQVKVGTGTREGCDVTAFCSTNGEDNSQ
ncbi:hypothetical protein SAMN05421578_13812 [Paenibacillus macquariensis]|uniref:Uncharacterized protein n=1 Tax=Paenibacillus macquariensis TaxID=948756 RepID=A0ABY1KH44_9BACL|nr:hypothetical protein SAMN05421578_13812 [Paenibacillus macquariensis]